MNYTYKHTNYKRYVRYVYIYRFGTHSPDTTYEWGSAENDFLSGVPFCKSVDEAKTIISQAVFRNNRLRFPFYAEHERTERGIPHTRGEEIGNHDPDPDIRSGTEHIRSQ